MEHVAQLLSVWNPYTEPQTVAEHVAVLRRAGHVWWGRIKEGRPLSAAEARERKWPRVAEVADACAASGREPALFVTDFQSLHALRVAEIRFGELPPGEEDRVPSYYRAKGKHVPLWFRVTDVRALSHDRLTTLRYFAEGLGEVDAFGAEPGGGFHYDPFAACTHVYPIVVPGPPTTALFDLALLAGHRRAVGRFADLRETLFPPEIADAHDALAASLGDRIWAALEEKSRSFLATAWVIHGRHARASGFDLAVIVAGLARALEVELWEGVLDRLQALGERARLDEPVLVEVTGRERRTLGSASRHLLPSLTPVARRLALPELERLAGDRDWNRWLEGFVGVRNQLFHGGAIRPAVFRRHWDQLLAGADRSRFGPLAAAKTEVRGRLLEARPAPGGTRRRTRRADVAAPA